MADLYVDDGGSNTSPFDTWAKACTTGIKGAIADAACVAGSRIFVGHDSIYTEGAGNVTYTSAGTAANPVIVYSADNTSGEPPSTYTAGAIEDIDGGVYSITTTGHIVFYGITFKSGNLFRIAGNSIVKLVDCTLQLNRNFAAALLSIANVGSILLFENTNLSFVNVGAGITIGNGSVFEWRGGTLQTTDLNELFTGHAGYANIVAIRGVDLSIMNSGALINGWGSSGDEPDYFEFSGCKFNANVPALVTDTTPVNWPGIAKMISCHSGNIPFFQEHTYSGDVYFDTAEYLDATYDGTNGYSAKLVTNANASFNRPLRFKLADIWCAANPTLTVHFTHDINGDGSDAQNDELWIEIEYPTNANAAYRQWDRTSKMAVLGTPADLTTQGTYNSIAETISGGAAGIHTVWVCMGVASKTIYADPKIDVT